MSREVLKTDADLLRRFCEFSSLADLDLHSSRLPQNFHSDLSHRLIRTGVGTGIMGSRVRQSLGLSSVGIPDSFSFQHQLALIPGPQLVDTISLSARVLMRPLVLRTISRDARHALEQCIGQQEMEFLRREVPLLISGPDQNRLAKLIESGGNLHPDQMLESAISCVLALLWGQESSAFQARVHLKLPLEWAPASDLISSPSDSRILAALATRIAARRVPEESTTCFD